MPTVADRVAQTVVRLYLEPKVEPIFHPDSYGYRPGRSALEAVATCRERCWRKDWVIDLDIRAFFDCIPMGPRAQGGGEHTDQRWILLYVERWLKAPLQQEDGTLVQRDRGTPQGSAISPLLANLFLHYAFDTWMAREFPTVSSSATAMTWWCTAQSEAQASHVLAAIAERLAQVGLELASGQDAHRVLQGRGPPGSHEHERFNFLGYTFRPRLSKSRHGKHLRELPAGGRATTP